MLCDSKLNVMRSAAALSHRSFRTPRSFIKKWANTLCEDSPEMHHQPDGFVSDFKPARHDICERFPIWIPSVSVWSLNWLRRKHPSPGVSWGSANHSPSTCLAWNWVLPGTRRWQEGAENNGQADLAWSLASSSLFSTIIGCLSKECSELCTLLIFSSAALTFQSNSLFVHPEGWCP